MVKMLATSDKSHAKLKKCADELGYKLNELTEEFIDELYNATFKK